MTNAILSEALWLRERKDVKQVKEVNERRRHIEREKEKRDGF